jgi:acyl-coenzyme A synthetase/AMP-(fatty) acid ligase
MHALIRSLASGRGLYIGRIFERAAERYPDLRVTLDQPLPWAPDGNTEFTSVELAELIDDLAARAWAAGVRPTERVAIYKSHNFDIALLACAVARIGAVPALLSPALDEDIAFILLGRLGSPWLLSDGSTLSKRLEKFAVSEVTRGVLLAPGEDAAGATSLSSLGDVPHRDPVMLHPSEHSMITHSSGTTGLPKLAVHTHESGFHRFVPQRLAAWPIRGREKAALCMTFVHSRFYLGLSTWLSLGNSLVIASDPDPHRVGPLLARTRPGYVETHPNNFVDWEELDTAPDQPLSSIRYFFSTFDAMHPRTIRRMLSASRRPQPLFLQAYAQSEIGPIAARWYSRRTTESADARCVGLPLPGFISLRVVDANGSKLPAGEAGYLEVRSRSRILTYLGEEERYQSQLHDGWWRLGDMGYLDRWGLLHLLDREVDQIESVPSNLQVEDVLMSRLEELREIVIVAGAHGEPVPVVSTRDDKPIDQSRWAAATRDLPQMAPVRQMAFKDLPRTSTWKIKRHQITKQLREEAPPEQAST